jgi:hypothetical protein
MKKILLYTFLLVLIITAFFFLKNGRTESYYEKEELETSLVMAGENREELEKVIAYYSRNPSDIQKLEAAKYLISNMQGHFSTEEHKEVPDLIKLSFQYLNSLTQSTYYRNPQAPSFEFVDTLHKILYTDFYTPEPEFIDTAIWLKNNREQYPFVESGKTELFEKEVSEIGENLLENINPEKPNKVLEQDLQYITADYLISHIDNAFKVWRRSPFASRLSYKEFIETILPYRYRNEPLDISSELYFRHFYSVFHSPVSININETVRRFNFYTYCMDCYENEGKYLGDFGVYDILQFYQFECERHSIWSCKVLNRCGIPAYYNFTPSWRNRDRHHFWVSVRDTSGKFMPFTPKWQLLNDTAYFNRTSKVFRKTFKIQNESPYKIKHENEKVPKVFNNPFIKDVSAEYHEVTDLTVPITIIPENKGLGYLGIFTPTGWKPVAWGTINKKEGIIEFKDVPVNIMYIAGFYENKELVPIGRPFYINSKKEVEEIKADNKNRTDITVTRKYPQKEKMINRMKEMVGARIEGANNPDFPDAVIIHVFSEQELSDLVVRAIDINKRGKFRYIRCVPPKDKMVNIAIMEAYKSVKNREDLNAGSQPYITSPEEIFLNEEMQLSLINSKPFGEDTTLVNITDGNMETYYKGFSAILDLGRPERITQIRFAPRNANNSIVAGNSYELFYYDDKWRSAGRQRAKYNYLEYKNLPRNTVYWLRNINGGKEELAFIYKNGKQVFVNHDKIDSIKYLESDEL